MKSSSYKKALVFTQEPFVTFVSKWRARLLPPTDAKNLQLCRTNAFSKSDSGQRRQSGLASPGCNQELREFLILSHLTSSPEHFYLMSYETQNTCSDPGQNKSMGVTSCLMMFFPTFTVRNSSCLPVVLQVFLVRKVTPPDANQLYAMKVLKKATLKGTTGRLLPREQNWLAGLAI